ncbi:hypothetical protein ABL78_6243 [Leptomonas seymouri]|uniref:Uncharacterized protein n=1 Tax=Leptomonas seymouri TaxID=5684 RepID=A0A0N0P4D2_LEPSE|nr:hypothetical protein ABL78_6243 [Leptomonas seymouri]|eukprot:KPI84697.1 hypothetical protein ABL78_6243 [Leptomonas seymouri]
MPESHEQLRASRRQRASPSISTPVAVPSPAPALPGSESTRHCGVFLYINGLLCRTADSTGEFRPCDVFGGVDRVPVCTSFPVPTLVKDGEQSVLPRDAAGTEKGAVAFESDCPIFNTFGVLTGGVLIDPFNETFADYTQTTPYTVMGIKSSGRNALVLPEEHPSDAEEVRNANELAFRRGDFARIRPESAVTLCTSELTLPPPAPVLSASSSIVKQTARCPALRRYRFYVSTAMVDEWYDKLAIPSGVTPKEAEGHKRTWQDAEAFRQRLMNDSVSRSLEPQNFFPPAIPFLYRERGAPVRVKPEEERAGVGSPLGGSTIDAESDGGLVDVSLPGVRSAASAFVCYSGQPRFSTDGLNPSRPTAREQRTPPLPVRLRKRLRPYTSAEYTRGQSRRMLEQRNAQDYSTESLWDGAASDNRGGHDTKEYFLVPYSSDHPRAAAFCLFQTYFNHLGLLCNGTRVTGETEASSVRELPRGGRHEWGLCPDEEYTVEAEVHRKRRITRALWSNAEKSFPGGSRWSTTGGNHRVVSAAFTALMTSNRDALLERIHALHLHLRRLCEEAPTSIQ